jgi:two-component SAPR family response regulator
MLEDHFRDMTVHPDNARLPETARAVGGKPVLEIRTLGTAQVLVDGANAAFHSKTAEELFFYLLAHPEGKTKEDILETLWSETPSKESNNRFRVTVHRVRSALGDSEAIVETYGRYRLHTNVLERTDMQQLFKALEIANNTTEPPERLAAFQRVLRVYQGDFLPNVQADWALEAREELKSVYVRTSLELSLLHCDQGACEGAVSALVRALRADPYIGENYHQKLMTCLSVVEGKYAAIEHYRRFLHFLRDQLDDTAMPETVLLAQRIKNGERICNNTHSPLNPVVLQNCPFTPDGSCPGDGNSLMRVFNPETTALEG